MKSKWKVTLEKAGETLHNRIFSVIVKDGTGEFTFRVEVDKNYSKELFDTEVSNLLLVQQSFMFLLEREPPTSILRDFNLREIEKYFPNYRSAIRAVFMG